MLRAIRGRGRARRGDTAGYRRSARLRGDVLEIAVTTDVAAGSAPQLFVAVLESALSSEVKAGENHGRRLEHDNVVRVLEGPLPAASRPVTIRLSPDWNRTRLGVAAFLQEPASGQVLQTLAAPLCPA
ncbi:MAG: DUF1223 domain-containing protein [Burkholderiales bacterium]